MGRRKTTAKRELEALEALKDWLLGESVSFRALDDLRRRLRLDEGLFARLLGVSAQTFGGWRKRREVPISRRGHTRDSMHGEVERYQVQLLASGNGRLEAVLGGLALHSDGTSAPCWRVAAAGEATPAEPTRESAPHLWIPTEGKGKPGSRVRVRETEEMEGEELRTLHGVQGGDDYAGGGCRCPECAG